MGIAEEKYDKERGLYYDHTTVYKKDKAPDTMGPTRRRIEDLEEKVNLNNKRINHLSDQYNELWSELAKFKRLVLEGRDDWQGTTLGVDKNKK